MKQQGKTAKEPIKQLPQEPADAKKKQQQNNRDSIQQEKIVAKEQNQQQQGQSNKQNAKDQKIQLAPLNPQVQVKKLENSMLNESKLQISRSMQNLSNRTLNNKTIRYLSNLDPIEILPSEIIFKDIQVNQTYEIQVFVRNLTKTTRRIRVFQPQSTKFRIDYGVIGGIAAGLAIKLTVSFETSVLEDVHDQMKIVSDNGYEKDIPLHAYVSSGQVIFEPFINLGFIKLGKEKREEILFKNEGNAPAKIDLKTYDVNEIQFETPTFTIKPGQEFSAVFKYTPKDAGIYRGVIEIVTDAQCLQKHIDINATSVEFTRFIIDENGSQVSQFDFGTFYYGQKKAIIGYLVNNTPKKYRFKTRFRFGLLYSLDDMTNVQPPNIVGREQTEKIMYCEPSEGIIDSYSQVELMFKCQSQVDYQNLLWAQKYCLEKDELTPKIQDQFYSAIFEFDGDQQEPLILHLSGRGICPMVKFSKTLLQFGECLVNDYRDIILVLENRNKDLPIDINIQNTPGFQFEPKKFTIQEGGQVPITVRFQPKSVGKFNQNMIIKLVESAYDVKVKLYGDSTEIGLRQNQQRGPESLPEDFFMESKIIDEDSIQFNSIKKKFDQSSISSYPKYLESILDTTQIAKIEEFKKSFDNRQKYNNELKEQRMQRLKKEKDQKVQEKFQQIKEKLKLLGYDDGDSKENDEDDENKKPLGSNPFKDAPIDYEYEVGMVDSKVEPPSLNLPEAKESLFVTKPIDDYEPFKQDDIKHFEPDPNVPVKKKFSSEPKNHSEIRDVNATLDGYQLQKVFAGPIYIEFGNVYVNSEMVKTFKIRNDLRAAISVRLFTDRQELKKTYQKAQIIPSGQTAGFEIILNSRNLGPLRSNIKYFINEKHSFEFQIVANIELVKIEISKPLLKMSFGEDNIEMITKETIKLVNNGNAPGKFKWHTNNSKIFTITPEESVVHPQKPVECTIVYKPSSVQQIANTSSTGASFLQPSNQTSAQAITRTEEEKLILKVTDGIEQQLKCIGSYAEAKCSLKQQSLDLKEISVAQLIERTFEIKNNNRQPAVFCIDESKLPEGVVISQMKGKIGSDDTKVLNLKFSSKKECNIKGDIVILIRGGKTLKLPFSVQTIIPDIQINQDKFDFGNITTLGNPGQLEMHLTNNSSITAELVLDLRYDEEKDGMDEEKDGLDCLDVLCLEQADESILHSIADHEEEQQQIDSKSKQNANQPVTYNNNNADDEFDQENLDVSEQSVDEEEETKLCKYYSLTIKPGQTLHFQLKFSPKSFKQYKFLFPIQLREYGLIDGLKRFIFCRGLKPKFLIDPQILDFGKKIITAPDKQSTGKQSVLSFSNPDKNSVFWHVDTNVLGNDRIFDIRPDSGEVGPGESKNISVFFNPFEPGVYEKQIPLFVKDPDVKINSSYIDITLKGEGAFPKLLFDRKEIILPIVPLGVEAKCVFRIINSGYENLNLKYKIVDDISKLNIDLAFPEGKNLGITKNKIKVEATFSSKKPISFTTRIEFYDDAERSYDIQISGTTDNSLFTNYSYFQRYAGEFKIDLEHDRSPLKLEVDEDDLDSVDGLSDGRAGKAAAAAAKKKATGGAQSVVSAKTLSSYGSSKSTKSLLGYSPVPTQYLEQNVEFLCRWLNFYVLTQTIQNFPNSIIESNGFQVFDILTYLSGKTTFNFKANIDSSTKRLEKIEKLYKQYDELIRTLKVEGALLNHIRPEYLFSYNDYLFYLKTLPEKKQQNLTPSALKMPALRFQYLSIEAWTSLIYQMIKIYYLSRINPKTFKSVPGLPPEKAQIPEYIEGSNFISSSEALLLNWFEIHNEIIHPIQKRRIRNFDEDFQDSNLYASVIQSYVGKSCYKYFNTMKSSCSSDIEINYNAEKLIQGLTEIGMQTHLNVKDLVKPSMRETLLFCIQLFFSLPHYIPKGQPIIFQCVLGEEVIKNIELQNPTNKPISYWVQLESQGGDFSLESDDNFVIEPKQTYKFKVKFTSRISESVSGRIRFTNKKESNVSAAALVFELKSQIIGRISEINWTVNAQLYETVEKQIQVTNKFQSESGEFMIIITQEKFKNAEEMKKKRANKKSLNSQGEQQQSLSNINDNTALAPTKKQENEIFPSFFCQKASIRLKKGQTTTITIVFIPLVMETQKCFIIFKDPNVGEFQHEMVGTVEIPSLLPDIIRFPLTGYPTIFVDENSQQEVEIPFANDPMLKARKQVEQLIVEKNRDKYMRGDKTQVIRPEKLNFPGGNPDSVQYEIEMNPPNSFISIKSQFFVINPFRFTKNKQEKQERNTGESKKANQNHTEESGNVLQANQTGQAFAGQGINKYPFQFLFKQPVKDYKFNLTFKNAQKTDIRRYRCEITVFPKPIKATLEFRVPARHSTTQEIPIINNTERDWNIKVNLIQDAKNALLFTAPSHILKDFFVKKKSTGVYPITFSPNWLIQAESKLSLFNPLTNDQFEYDLKGYGEEPVAEDHIVISCKAKQPTTKEIEIRNPYTDKEIIYRVETDLINASGPSSLAIKPGKKAKYVLTLNPILSGQYTGSITFYENDEKYLWYTVLLNTESPKPDKCIEMSTQVRQAATFSIEIKNPLNQDATFEVMINGEGLIGDTLFNLPAKSEGNYELIYSPLIVGRQRGSIAFINELLGEIWYELSLTCEDQLPVRMNVLRCELGKVEAHQIFLENPSEKEVKATTKVSNPTNFDVIPDNIVLKPLSKTPIQIRYMPSNLEVTEQGEVTISTQEIGKWKFLTFGIGIPPTKFEPRLISVGLNKDFSTTIHFKNPFKENINVTITLEATGENKEVFKLLTKTKKNEGEKSIMQVPGMNVIQIPFSFVPREINCYYCEIVVQMNEKIEWRYPIKGVTESVVNQIIYHLKTQCRSTVEEEMKIQLPGIMSFITNEDKFEFELDGISDEFNTLIRQSLQIKTVKNYLTSSNDHLEFQAKFSPLKPFKQTIDFNILRQAGGRWKFKITLEATEPKEDDIIIISSPLHKTTSVTFKLTNKSKSFTPFTASFTPDSDAEFTVMPRSGNLESYGREGTTFIVSFTPIEYGKTRQGKLIIQTDEMMWSYLVKGTLPKYNPPQIEQSMIDNKLDIDLASKSLHNNHSKNFMAENVIKMKNSQVESNMKQLQKHNSSLSLQLRNKKF
ncbi:hypothetical protein ABPG72_019754 [Tetrahymena utriculariae]